MFNSRKRTLNLRIVCGRLYMGVDCMVIMTVKGWKNTYLCKQRQHHREPQAAQRTRDSPSAVHNKNNN